MTKEKPNSEDYQSKLGEVLRASHKKKVDELFSSYPNSIDWADDLAKDVIVGMFDTIEFMDGWRKFLTKQDKSGGEKRREEFAWALMVPLSLELRHLRSDAMSVVDGKVRLRGRKLAKELESASCLAESIRNKAGELDSKGMTTEANMLRDAANILNEEF
jgi:hypothetical protein